jgi:NAD+ synthase (glutamine-hydrolysing)
VKVYVAQLNPIIGDLAYNTKKIIEAIQAGKKQKADLVLFSELVLSGYPPQDLLLMPHFIESVEKHLRLILEATDEIIAIVGLPRVNPSNFEKSLFNSAAIIQNKQLIGFQDKSLLPTYDVFDERRYFEPANQSQIWKLNDTNVVITICEDIWQSSELLRDVSYRKDPLKELLELEPDLILNLSSSPFSVDKLQTRLKVCSNAAERLNCPIIYCNQVGANDSLIFDGYSLVVNDQGQLVMLATGFKEDNFLVDTQKLPSPCTFKQEEIQDLFKAIVLGVRDYFKKQGFKRAVLGLSGGIDSAVAACIAKEALGEDCVLGLGMPSRFSSEGSVSDAKKLALNLNISFKVIPIEDPFSSYLELLTPYFENKPTDVTEENLQARIRGMILMAFSNKFGYIVLNTGNKSEMAMGYATLYGDMCGGLSVLSDVTKQQVYALAHFINRDHEIIPVSTIEKPPSAELRPNQKDQDSLPEYDVIDQVLKCYVEEHQSPEQISKQTGYSIELVNDLIKRIHRNEYKRRQSPLGLRVSEKAFFSGRSFPIVEKWV